jgi:hypothetical protein
MLYILSKGRYEGESMAQFRITVSGGLDTRNCMNCMGNLTL